MTRDQAIELTKEVYASGFYPELYCRLSEWGLCFADFVPGECADCKVDFWGVRIADDYSPLKYADALEWLEFYRVTKDDLNKEGGVKNMRKVLTVIATVFSVVLPVLADAPIDLTGTGTTLAGYVATAATAALGVLAAIWGVRVIIRAFRAAIGR